MSWIAAGLICTFLLAPGSPDPARAVAVSRPERPPDGAILGTPGNAPSTVTRNTEAESAAEARRAAGSEARARAESAAEDRRAVHSEARVQAVPAADLRTRAGAPAPDPPARADGKTVADPGPRAAGATAAEQGVTAADAHAGGAPQTAAGEGPPEPERTTTRHRFWDTANVALFAGVTASRFLDYASTRHFRALGDPEVLLTNRIVDDKPLFVGIELAGAAASVAASGWLHRHGHHTLERWLSVTHIGVTTFGAVRNYRLRAPGR